MSEAKQDGGPAFPGAYLSGSHGDYFTAYESGMSLRQWYAGKALQGLLAHYGAGKTRDDLSALSFQYADDMIREEHK